MVQQFAFLYYVKKNHAIIKDKCTKKEKASKTTVIHVNVRMAMLPAHALHVHAENLVFLMAEHTKMERASQVTAIRAHAEMEYHYVLLLPVKISQEHAQNILPETCCHALHCAIQTLIALGRRNVAQPDVAAAVLFQTLRRGFNPINFIVGTLCKLPII
ncbi:hypothetical protein DPMN_087610 [Dreissena polymorpha]|uniref:Uncharacterized protein n=1 Tax=Dreissena polymorpha TaxID=45954 RepID=A0A9D4KT00_DREPO|nr:hypothetical protein DPMN_087610 [Dreissena polymorpha]